MGKGSIAFLCSDGDIITRHVASHVTAIPQLDAGQPLHIGNPIVARNDEAQGCSVAMFHGGAVAVVGQKQGMLHGILQGHASPKRNLDLELPIGAWS